MPDLRALLTDGPQSGGRAGAALAARLAAGVIFVIFGVGKFTSHASEVSSFRTYGLPSPDAFVAAIGVVEIVGGVLLLAGLGTRIASVVLAGDMVGAIIVSGIGQGESISLTLAPALLLAMLFLLWTGPGRLALDRHIGAGRRSAGSRSNAAPETTAETVAGSPTAGDDG